MYYLNSFLLYSLLGFIMESTLFKNTSVARTSGVLNGPITLVYGIGGITIILIDKYILKKIKVNKYFKVILTFIVYTVVLTLVEGLSGYLCKIIFNTDMWNYTNKKYNIGKYMCLYYAPIWGLLGVFITYVLKPYFNKIIKVIPKEATYFFTLILFVDIVITLITK